MKSLLSVILLVAAAVLAGCSQQPQEAAGTPAATSQAQPAAAAPPAGTAIPPDAGALPAGTGEGLPAAYAPGTPPPAEGGTPAADTGSDIPSYPGATVAEQQTGSGKGGWARITEVKLTTTATLQEVKAFYDNYIKSAGWQVTGFQDKPFKAYWRLAKAPNATAEIEVETARAGGVRIKIEQKSR
ncbi:MAG: hypothetical protein KA419_01875 [Acidobacteria bacterium]|nr:hypothetical protein [Acidobacteriota bacterium]